MTGVCLPERTERRMKTANDFSFQNTDIRDIDRSQLADRRDVVIDRKLPQRERLAEFYRQTKGHPDCMIIDGVVVLCRFADTDATIEDRLSAAIRNA